MNVEEALRISREATQSSRMRIWQTLTGLSAARQTLEAATQRIQACRVLLNKTNGACDGQVLPQPPASAAAGER